MLYYAYIRLSLRSQMQYRMSFWFTASAQLATAFFGFLSMYLLFDRFGSIAGWSLGEAALCRGVTTCAFALAECIARSFDGFHRFMLHGDFDRLLLRPRGLVLQVLGSKFELSRIGRFIQAIFTLLYAAQLLQMQWTALRIAVLCCMILSGTCVYSGLFIANACMCFFTTQGFELGNILTDGGREIASYPLPIYAKWALRFFTFIIPFACFNYLPLLFVTGRAEEKALLYLLTPLGGPLFLLPCIWIFYNGVRHYTGSGS